MSITQISLLQIACASVASLVPVQTCQCIFPGCRRANSYTYVCLGFSPSHYWAVQISQEV